MYLQIEQEKKKAEKLTHALYLLDRQKSNNYEAD